jgi:hypothetical protein
MHRVSAPHRPDVAEGLGVSWHTANSAIVAEGKRAVVEDPARFRGMAVIGVAEHVWRRTRRGRQVLHGHHRPHPGPRQDRPGTVVGHVRVGIPADRSNGPARRGYTRWASTSMSGSTRALVIRAANPCVRTIGRSRPSTTSASSTLRMTESPGGPAPTIPHARRPTDSVA